MQTIKYPLTIVLQKSESMIYFSQLDLAHILERALRRTDLPLYFTQGFNPHVKISFRKALKLGTEGTIEATFYFAEEISERKLTDSLTPQLPSGLTVLAVSK